MLGLLPGSILTDRTRELMRQATDDGAARIPLRRQGEPSEFGRVAAFLLSPAAGYVTEALAAAIAQGDDEAKARLKAFLEKRGPKVARK